MYAISPLMQRRETAIMGRSQENQLSLSEWIGVFRKRNRVIKTGFYRDRTGPGEEGEG